MALLTQEGMVFELKCGKKELSPCLGQVPALVFPAILPADHYHLLPPHKHGA